MATLYPGKKHTQLELLAAMREMRQEEGADYDAITFDNFFMWWTAQKDKQGGKVRAESSFTDACNTFVCFCF